jgi:hypothetical protein
VHTVVESWMTRSLFSARNENLTAHPSHVIGTSCVPTSTPTEHTVQLNLQCAAERCDARLSTLREEVKIEGMYIAACTSARVLHASSNALDAASTWNTKQ